MNSHTYQLTVVKCGRNKLPLVTFHNNARHEAQQLKHFVIHYHVNMLPLGCLLSRQVKLGTDGIFTLKLLGLDVQHDRVLARRLKIREVGVSIELSLKVV